MIKETCSCVTLKFKESSRIHCNSSDPISSRARSTRLQAINTQFHSKAAVKEAYRWPSTLSTKSLDKITLMFQSVKATCRLYISKNSPAQLTKRLLKARVIRPLHRLFKDVPRKCQRWSAVLSVCLIYPPWTSSHNKPKELSSKARS